MGKTDALLVLRLGSGAQVFFNDRELASQLVKALSASAGEVRWEQKPLEMKDPGEHREAVKAAVRGKSYESVGTVIGCTDPILRIGKTKAVDADLLFENDPWKKLKQDPLVHPAVPAHLDDGPAQRPQEGEGHQVFEVVWDERGAGVQGADGHHGGRVCGQELSPHGCGHPPKQNIKGIAISTRM